MSEPEITEEPSPLTLISVAMQSGASPEALEKLMDLQERYENANAQKAFSVAFVRAQSEMPTIFKAREAKHSRYASYDDIMRLARPVLDRNGLAVSFSQQDTETALSLNCEVSHIGGHSKTTSFTLPKDGPLRTNSGKDVTNLAQAQGSANSYAKRYCFCNTFNIVLGDQDDDAKALDAPIDTVSEDQARELFQFARKRK